MLRESSLKHLKGVHKQGTNSKHYCPTYGEESYYDDDLENHISVHEGELKHAYTKDSYNKAYSILKDLKGHQKHEVNIGILSKEVAYWRTSIPSHSLAHMVL